MSKAIVTDSTPIADLRNLGPASAKMLAQIGITNFAELKSRGAVTAYFEYCQVQPGKHSLNLLYAMLGAIEDKSWTEYCRCKGELLLELESLAEMAQLFAENTPEKPGD